MKKALLSLIFILLLFLAAEADSRDNYPSFLNKPNPSAVAIDFDIHPYIQKAKALLEKQEPTRFRVARKTKALEMENFQGEKIKVRIKKDKIEWFEVILAVMNVSERKIEIIKNVPFDGNVGKPSKFVVDWYRLNGINTPFRISKPEGYVVLAVRRAVHTENGMRDRIYVPFAPELDTPRLRKEGLDYILSLPKMAEAELRERQVWSRAQEGKLLVDVVPAKLFIELAHIEHIDHERFEKTLPEELVNEILVTFALNREDAYRYAASVGADARGISQFIRSTYTRMVQKYPGAQLVKNFSSGTADHVNSAKASLLLLDSDLRDILNSKQRKYLEDNPEELHSYLVSAYNCGSGRTLREIARWKKKWREFLPPETRIFLKKFEAVRSLFNPDRYASLKGSEENVP